MTYEIDWETSPLVAACVQDAATKKVLMIGYLSRESYEETLRTGDVVFYSRRRKKLWRKGETSGNTLKVLEILPDCDNDAVLILADPQGPTCHTLRPSCFDRTELDVLEESISERESQIDGHSYTQSLLKGPRKNLFKKVGEEATEVVVALAMQDKTDLLDEIADLVYHLSVSMRSRQVKWTEVFQVLALRRLRGLREVSSSSVPRSRTSSLQESEL